MNIFSFSLDTCKVVTEYAPCLHMNLLSSDSPGTQGALHSAIFGLYYFQRNYLLLFVYLSHLLILETPTVCVFTFRSPPPTPSFPTDFCFFIILLCAWRHFLLLISWTVTWIWVKTLLTFNSQDECLHRENHVFHLWKVLYVLYLDLLKCFCL